MPSSFGHARKVARVKKKKESLKVDQQDSSHKRVLSRPQRPVPDWLHWYGSYLTEEKCESDEKNFKAPHCCKRVTKQRWQTETFLGIFFP